MHKNSNFSISLPTIFISYFGFFMIAILMSMKWYLIMDFKLFKNDNTRIWIHIVLTPESMFTHEIILLLIHLSLGNFCFWSEFAEFAFLP